MENEKLKARLEELASSIQYADQFDLTEAPSLIRGAILKIVELEVELVKWIELNYFGPRGRNQGRKGSDPFERHVAQAELTERGIAHTAKDSTDRLLRLLQKPTVGVWS